MKHLLFALLLWFPLISGAVNDCTQTGQSGYVCTSTNGNAFAASATTDTTNGSNITSGTVGAGRFPGGVMPTLFVPFQSSATAGITWTNMPAAATLLNGSSRFVTRVDLSSGYTQARIIVLVTGTACVSGATLELMYNTSGSLVVGNYLTMGSSAINVDCSSGTNTVLSSSWINLVAGAKADSYIAIVGAGGNGSTSPTFGNISAEFR